MTSDLPPQQALAQIETSTELGPTSTQGSFGGDIEVPGSLDPQQLSYLCDVAAHLFSPALERDARLGFNRSQGVQVRRLLRDAGLVTVHRVSTGRRAGQVLLLRLTPSAVAHLEVAGVSAEVLGIDDFLQRFHAQRPTPDPAARKRSRIRKPRAKHRTRLFRECVRAYAHLHDLDYLQESPLIDVRIVRERVNQLSVLAEARALRAVLVESAKRAALDAGEMPAQAPLRRFLEQYIEGKRVTEIALDLGVTREWCSRAYRIQALELAAMQFERLAELADSAQSSRLD